MLTDLQSMWSSTRFTRQDKLFKSLVMTQKRDQMCVHRGSDGGRGCSVQMLAYVFTPSGLVHISWGALSVCFTKDSHLGSTLTTLETCSSPSFCTALSRPLCRPSHFHLAFLHTEITWLKRVCVAPPTPIGLWTGSKLAHVSLYLSLWFVGLWFFFFYSSSLSPTGLPFFKWSEALWWFSQGLGYFLL